METFASDDLENIDIHSGDRNGKVPLNPYTNTPISSDAFGSNWRRVDLVATENVLHSQSKPFELNDAKLNEVITLNTPWVPNGLVSFGQCVQVGSEFFQLLADDLTKVWFCYMVNTGKFFVFIPQPRSDFVESMLRKYRLPSEPDLDMSKRQRFRGAKIAATLSARSRPHQVSIYETHEKALQRPFSYRIVGNNV